MKYWYMLSVVGKDIPGIVAGIAQEICRFGGNLGEASMTRLGDSFTMMMMVNTELTRDEVEASLQPVAEVKGQRLHIDSIEGHLHHHLKPNVYVRVAGADRAGIVAEVTATLAAIGAHICTLETDVGGNDAQPIYIMHLEALCKNTVEDIQQQLKRVSEDGVDISVAAIDTMIG